MERDGVRVRDKRLVWKFRALMLRQGRDKERGHWKPGLFLVESFPHDV